MKRMSEVFDLPIHSLDITYAVNTCTDRDALAAHAVNHVDALADALEAMIEEFCRVNFPNRVTLDAGRVLAAYRGDK